MRWRSAHDNGPNYFGRFTFFSLKLLLITAAMNSQPDENRQADEIIAKCLFKRKTAQPL